MSNKKSALDLFECINRNILECKCRHDDEILSCLCVLIETYWNVNYQWGIWVTAHARVLIETYWNVNDIPGFLCLSGIAY